MVRNPSTRTLVSQIIHSQLNRVLVSLLLRFIERRVVVMRVVVVVVVILWKLLSLTRVFIVLVVLELIAVVLLMAQVVDVVAVLHHVLLSHRRSVGRRWVVINDGWRWHFDVVRALGAHVVTRAVYALQDGGGRWAAVLLLGNRLHRRLSFGEHVGDGGTASVLLNHCCKDKND